MSGRVGDIRVWVRTTPLSALASITSNCSQSMMRQRRGQADSEDRHCLISCTSEKVAYWDMPLLQQISSKRPSVFVRRNSQKRNRLPCSAYVQMDACLHGVY